jgi:hypothetical protein
MAFDSTVGGEDATAYITVAYANTYHTDRGHSDWSGTTTKRQQAIIRATDYVDKRFGPRFRGERENKDQALEWPRLNARDNDEFDYSGEDEIPRQLQKAIAEYALIAIRLINATDADLLPEGGSPTGPLASISQSVGPLSESKTFESGNDRAGQASVISDSSIPEYPAADLWIEELLHPAGFRRIARA